MANDPPTSMHMRYGSLEARDIGVTNFHGPRASSSINRDIEENAALRKLHAAVDKDPEWERFVRYWINEGCSAADTFEALQRAKKYMWLKLKMKASLKRRLQWTP